MTKVLISSIDIAAPAPVVWDLLVDFKAFPAPRVRCGSVADSRSACNLWAASR
jgi:hypothetical protein